MDTELLDVVIIGAGVSGIGAACHLTMKNPNHSFAVLEGRHVMGGTWDLFRYPGVRSDSDMYTFGYSFRPWKERKDIADAKDILKYLTETAADYGLDDKIRYQHRTTKADWNSAEKRWTISGQREDTNEPFSIACRFLITCTGYYNYDNGYLPEFAGYDDYQGIIAHPQHWPEDLDYSGKKIAVIGSGATAITLVPSLAKKAEHVTMVQRSPTYVFSRPAIDAIAVWANCWLPRTFAYKLIRVKNALIQRYSYSLARRRPEKIRATFRDMALQGVGPDVDVDVHFNPDYNPWDQRVCLIPDGDLFRVLREGSASIVTDHIERFTPNGLSLKSGDKIAADIIVPATGLNVEYLSGMKLFLDGEQVNASEQLSYRGMMFNNLPNIAAVIGYTNASWTLKVDLTCDYICRLLRHMDKQQYQVAMPSIEQCARHQEFKEIEQEPLVGLTSGYILRAQNELPKQGSIEPWRNHDNFIKDIFSVRYGKIEDGVMTFE